MKWLRKLSRRSRVLPPEGWLNFANRPGFDPAKHIPPYCTWCGTEWMHVGEDDYMLCPVCDYLKEATFA